MTQQTPAEQELAELIVGSLNLEKVAPESIDPEAPLFGGDLGLDSIDALELGIAIKKKYNVSFSAEDSENRKHFASVASLASFVRANLPA